MFSLNFFIFILISILIFCACVQGSKQDVVINLSGKDSYEVIVDQEKPKNVTIVVNYEQLKDNLPEFIPEWYDNKGNFINETNENYENFQNLTQIDLKIINVKLDFDGYFTLKLYPTIGENNETLAEKRICVKVIEKFKSQVLNNETKTIGEDTTIELELKEFSKSSLPKQNLKHICEFIKCQDEIFYSNDSLCQDENSNQNNNKYSDNKVSSQFKFKNNKKIIEVKFKPYQNGIIFCTVFNDYATMKFKTKITLKGLWISSKNKEQFVEDSKVEIKCHLSKYYVEQNYTFVDKPWSRNTQSINYTPKNFKNIVGEKGNFSETLAIMRFDNIKSSDSGIYQCHAKRKKSGNNSNFPSDIFVNVEFDVKEGSKPLIKKSENEDQIKRIEVNKNIKISCYADGFPTPTIVWFKNNQTINIESDNDKIDYNYFKRNANYDDSGEYKCIVQNSMGFDEKIFKVEIYNPYVVHIIVGTCGVCFFGFLIFLNIKQKRKIRRLKKSKFEDFQLGEIDRINPKINITYQADLLPYCKVFEFPRSKLKLEAQLGQGEFGVVYRATARYIIPFESETIVAVKTLKSYADEISFNVLASELKILSNLGHHLNIVNLLGAVTRKIVNHEILLILEYCSLGNLQSFLLVNRLNFEDDLGFCTKTSSDFLNELGKNYFGKQVRFVHKPNGYVQIPLRRNSTRPIIFDTFSNIDSRAPKTSDLVSWSFQCSRGMEYLSSKKIIHGDLAARNILLCDGNVIKITDFGLSKSLYKNYQITRDKKLPLPYKWLAIECFTDNIFSIQSDIWSYGILLWELFSLAQSPYPGFEQSVELYQFLIEGSRMEKPYVANDKIYQLMLQCWSKNPQERPLFHEISEVLGRFLHESVKGFYEDLNEPYQLLNEERKKVYFPLNQQNNDNEQIEK